MPASFPELFRLLSDFSPARADLRGAPFESYVDWAIAQGLAPLAAYNLEYRLGNCGAPQWARDRLLSIYQGSVNDNVMKLVNFKRQVSALSGRRMLLLGAASYAECVYPHVAFRPVADIELWLSAMDVEPFAGYLARGEFKAVDQEERGGRTKVLSDTRTLVLLHRDLVADAAEQKAVFARALPVPVYGPSLYRPDLEDALLAEASLMASAGFEVPMIRFVDLRELLLGVPSLGGDYSRPVQGAVLLERAKTWNVERALWACLRIVARLFPALEPVVAPLLPPLAMPTRELLERLLVAPVSELGRTRAFKGEDTLRALLTGG